MIEGMEGDREMVERGREGDGAAAVICRCSIFTSLSLRRLDF